VHCVAMGKIQVALLALSLGISGGCSSYSDPPTGRNPPPPRSLQNGISIGIGAAALTTVAFNPNPLVVSLDGKTSVSVRWVNEDITGGDYMDGTATIHSIASDNDAFIMSGELGGNATYSVTLTAEGDYPYHCAIHPNMVGTITVNP
jgi:plastocyanin